MSKKFKMYLVIVCMLISIPNGFVKAADVPSKGNSPAFAPNLVNDPSFELSNGSWTLYSDNFGIPTCTFAGCGGGASTAGPRSGSTWVWFGGTTAPTEYAYVHQNVTFPVGVATLQFYFWIGLADPGSDINDYFRVYIDGTAVFSANATQQSLYPTYTTINLDVSSFADGGVHNIWIESTTSGQIVNFNVDDVSLKNSGIPTPSFSDVPLSHPYFEDIEILYANGYTAGCSTSSLVFCPNLTMNRAQSAVFMVRGNFGNAYTPPPAPWTTFGDNFSPGPWAQPWAQGMFDAGLTAGCSTNPRLFCPWEEMPRFQAAVFGMRLKEGINYPPPAGTGAVFADVNGSEWYSGWVEQAYLNGLLPACGSQGNMPLFCPNSLVSRGLVAYMIVRAKNLTMP